MSTNDDMWLDARDAWGIDRLAWKDDEGDDDDTIAERSESEQAELEARGV